jgi:subtilisin family serine protease
MPKHRKIVAVALAVMAVTASSIAAANAAPEKADSSRSAAVARQPTVGAEEYVVAFEGGADAAQAAIADAGGTVVNVNEAASIALVETTNAGFLGDVRAEDAVTGAIRNHSVGTSRLGMPHRYATERPSTADRRSARGRGHGGGHGPHASKGEPLSNLQWDMAMIGATPDGAHRRATGKGVDVGIIDTGIDASHPDIAPNFDNRRSRNFTMDIPAIDGPCEVSTCIDPANVDDGGHGTHVSGTVAGDDNGFGIGGVAPDAKLVNLRAGQDSGFFFLYETVAALTEAGNLHLDVVNMSFYTDPWLFNCSSRDDYVSGEVSDEELAEQVMTRDLVLNAVKYAYDRGVTLVGSAGNEHTDLTAPTRSDETSPDYPADIDGNPLAAHPRVVTNNCLDLPNEAPQVIGVSALGPSTTKADYSNYGLNEVEISAPGGWFRDGIGTPTFQTPNNLIWSSYPLHVAIEEGLANPDGTPTDEFSTQYCNSRGKCGFYTTLQGTSMASPHVTGVVALIVDRFGHSTRGGGKALDPATVRRILERTATDHACPAGGVEIYTDEGRTPDFNAACVGTTAENSLYGEGIVNATRAVR